jgi:hypothetical protein
LCRTDNVYQYRLFELLPILRELDPSKAEQLSNDPQVQARLSKYPNGLQSLDPTVRDTPMRKGEEPGMQVGVRRGAKVVQDSHSAEIYQRQENEILKQAGDEPRQAIATAATLPVQAGHTVPRSETLLSIAQVGWKKNPSASKEALEQMADSLKKGVDGDDNDSNRDLKVWWPSVALFSAILRSAAHISPQTALELIHKLQDPDLVTLFQIRLANDRLGADEESLH